MLVFVYSRTVFHTKWVTTLQNGHETNFHFAFPWLFIAMKVASYVRIVTLLMSFAVLHYLLLLICSVVPKLITYYQLQFFF
jgi:hypothetical protein